MPLLKAQVPTEAEIKAETGPFQIDFWWATLVENWSYERLQNIPPLCNSMEGAIRMVFPYLAEKDYQWEISNRLNHEGYGSVIVSSKETGLWLAEVNLYRSDACSMSMAVFKAGLITHLKRNEQNEPSD